METSVFDARVALRFFQTVLLVTAVVLPAMGRPQCPEQGLQAVDYRPFVYVSAISIRPGEIHQKAPPKPPAAVLTVQIFHQAVNTPQTVTLEVGSYSGNPATEIAIVYKPENQTIAIPPGPAGNLTITANVERVDIGTHSIATVVIAATLANPSPGIRIVTSPPENYRATLKIRNP